MRYGFILFFWWISRSVLGQTPLNKATDLRAELKPIAEAMNGGWAVADERVLNRLNNLYRQAQEPADQIRINNLLAQEYFILGRMKEAERAYKEAFRLSQRHEDSLSVAHSVSNLGRLYLNEGRLSESLSRFLEALRLREKHGARKPALALSYTYIGRVHTQVGDLKAAEKYLLKAYQLKAEARDTSALGMINISMANVHRRNRRFALAESLYKKDLPKRLSNNNLEGAMENYRGLAETYKDWKRYDEAIFYYEKNVALARRLNRRRAEGLLLLELANLHEQQGQLTQARAVLKQAGLATDSSESVALQHATYQRLADFNAREGNFPLAYRYLQRAVAVRDSVVNENSQKMLSELRAQFEVSQKEREIAALDEQNKAQQRLRNYLLASIGVLLLLLTGIIYLSVARRKAYKKLTLEQQHTQQLLTEKEQLLNNLHQAQVQLVQSEKMASLGLLTAGIAHEINNPIGYINASMSALQMDFQELNPIRKKLLALRSEPNLPAPVRELLTDLERIGATDLFNEMNSLMHSIERGTQRTTEIVAGLKTFARDTGDAFVLSDLHEGIDSALTLLNHKRHEGILIEKNYGILPPVPCQFSKINQVFLNLLDNAIQAVGEAGTVSIGTRHDAQYAYVQISDTGVGMDLVTQQRIFEPFFTTKEVGSGTGLGLSISYAIVQQHRGQIQVESSPGHGTTFTICLPFSHN
jgi:two-component system, NtrC family, sensor kinase